LENIMKSNNETATLRKGSLPKSEPVRQAQIVRGKAVECAHKQNENDGGPSVAVTPTRYISAPTGCDE